MTIYCTPFLNNPIYKFDVYLHRERVFQNDNMCHMPTSPHIISCSFRFHRSRNLLEGREAYYHRIRTSYRLVCSG